MTPRFDGRLLLAQGLLVIALAPLVSGLIKKTKAILENRQGASLLQPYWDLLKNFGKEEVVSETTSWIFRATPNICLGAMLAACFLIPVIVAGTFLGFAADLIALVYFLALPRFSWRWRALTPAAPLAGWAPPVR